MRVSADHSITSHNGTPTSRPTTAHVERACHSCLSTSALGNPLPFGPGAFYVLPVYWFGRPPYVRWVAAGILLAVAVLLEFRPTSYVLHPFTAEVVAAGSPPEVEWRKVPEGLFPAPDLAGAVATHVVAAGEPITPSDVTAAASPPPGWWQVALEVSFTLVPGADVQIVLTDASKTVQAVVVRMGAADSLHGPVALVAVPADDAAAVARAVASRKFVVLAAS